MDMNEVFPGSLGGGRKGVMSAVQPAYWGSWGLGLLCFGLLIFVRSIPLSDLSSLWIYEVGNFLPLKLFASCCRRHYHSGLNMERYALLCGLDMARRMVVRYIARGLYDCSCPCSLKNTRGSLCLNEESISLALAVVLSASGPRQSLTVR
jgi:hypothetical protein